MRAVKIAVIVMGVLIVLGTTGLVMTIIHRLSAPIGPVSATTPAFFAVGLDEPAGTRIAGIAAVRDRLAILLQGGGADRVVLIDTATGSTSGRISLEK